MEDLREELRQAKLRIDLLVAEREELKHKLDDALFHCCVEEEGK